MCPPVHHLSVAIPGPDQSILEPIHVSSEEDRPIDEEQPVDELPFNELLASMKTTN
jgi:hypothetical protein